MAVARISLAVVSEVEREQVESEVAQMVDVRMHAPSVPVIFVAIDDQTGLLPGAGAKVAA